MGTGTSLRWFLCPGQEKKKGGGSKGEGSKGGIMQKCKTNIELKKGKDTFYLTMHSTHFIYGNIASDIW